MLTELGKRINELSENLNKELERDKYKKKQSELKITITEMKDILGGINID